MIKTIWHVVTNEYGTVLGVYGEALLADAQELARRVARETACYTHVHQWNAPVALRPRVGQTIPKLCREATHD